MSDAILEGSRILLVDDEELLAWSIETEFKSHGADMISAHSLKMAIEAFPRHQPDLVICDLRLPDGSGLELIKKWRTEKHEIPIILITAHGGVQSAIDALRLGAFDYLQKPFDMKSLLAAAKRATELSRLRAKVHSLTGQERPNRKLNIVGQSPKVKKLVRDLKAVASSHCSTVLILGESGTGKELAARAVHEWSKKARMPFVEINCSSIPAGLLESELFGYEKGAFTDARDRKLGLFEMAGEGTIFLDEIGEMPLNLQAKLLRVLESRRFKRLGGTKDIFFQSRIVAATNRDLLEEIKLDRFRSDLYYRIHTLPIVLPALRERIEDVPELSSFFIKQLAEELQLNEPELTSDAIQKLSNHAWPGNIRELRNVLERSMVLSPSTVIRASDINFDQNIFSKTLLPPELSSKSFFDNARAGEISPNSYELEPRKLTSEPLQKSSRSFRSQGAFLETEDQGGLNLDHLRQDWQLPAGGINLEELEKKLIEQALDRTQNNQTRAAALLGISRHTFRYRLEKHKILGA